MANDKKKNGDTATETPKRKSMLGAYLPAGKTEKDIILTGQLLPQYLGKQLLEKLCIAKGVRTVKELTDEDIDSIVPVVGVYKMAEILPVQKRDEGKDFSPISLIIAELREPVIGFRGKDEDRKEVPVAKGGEILLPVTGQATVNKQLHDMIRDTEHLYLVAARPVGETKLEKRPSPMTEWEIEIVKLDEKRADRGASWAFPTWYMVVVNTGDLVSSIRNKEHVGLLHVHSEDGFDVTPVGNVINRKTGELLGRFEGGRVLPPKADAVVNAPS